MIPGYLHSVAVFVGLMLLSGCGQTVGKPAQSATNNARTVSVQTVSVAAQDIVRTTTQPATVRPYARAEIRARVTGYVDEVKVDIGDYVESGSELAVIDIPEMQKQREVRQARLARLEAEAQRSRAAVALADANVTSVKARFAEATSQLQRADALLAAAEAEFTRVRDLVDRQSLEGRLLDEARKKRDANLANQAAVRSSINSAKADVDVSLAQKAAAEADLLAAHAETAIAVKEREELDVLMNYATLKAPFAGVVTARAVDPGDLVREGPDGGSMGGQPLFVISQINKVRIQITVPEIEAALVNVGDAVELTFPSFPAESITAAVSRLTHSLDPSTRTMLVEADYLNEENKLLPGMFGQATITLATKAAANMLPARSVRFTATGAAFVYVVDDNDRVTIVDVTTGQDDGQSIEMISGVRAGQRVVDAHLKRLTDGQTVTVLK
jgi:HlyD family secretion protein